MSAVPQFLALPLQPASRWRQAATALLLAQVAMLLVYHQTVWSMVQIWWRSDTYAHGLLVLPISLWLVWRQRSSLAVLQPQAAPLWLLPLLLAGMLWLVGELALVNALTQAALVAQLVLAVPVLLGTAVARRLMFPLAFLFFAVPVGDFLLPLLMQWTADVTIAALRLSGIPVWREGNSFAIPSGRWSVVEACSGVRYLIASFMVGSLFAYLSYRSLGRRLMFMAAALLVPVLANWMRAYMIVMLGHLSDNRIATGVDHVLYGWVFFGIVIALMFVIGARWSQAPLPEGEGPPVSGQQPAPVPVHAQAVTTAAPQRPIWVAGLGLALLAALPPLANWRLDQSTGPIPDSAMAAALSAPQLAAQWPLAEIQTPGFRPAYRAPPAEWQGVYGPPWRQVGVYVALYRQQQRGQTLISSDNALLPTADPQWLLASQSRHDVRLPDQTLRLHSSMLLGTDGRTSLDAPRLQVWQMYWVHGRITTSAPMAKWYGALARLSGQRDAAAVLLAYAPSGKAGEGDAALAAFWADNYTALSHWLLRNSGASADALEISP